MYINGHYEYSKKTLQSIAENYLTIYDGLPLGLTEVYELFNLAEYKADFDVAFRQLGHARYPKRALSLNLASGDIKDYWRYSKAQQLVIAGMLGYEDWELERLGFYDVKRLRATAYYVLQALLNGSLKGRPKTAPSPVVSMV